MSDTGKREIRANKFLCNVISNEFWSLCLDDGEPVLVREFVSLREE